MSTSGGTSGGGGGAQFGYVSASIDPTSYDSPSCAIPLVVAVGIKMTALNVPFLVGAAGLTAGAVLQLTNTTTAVTVARCQLVVCNQTATQLLAVSNSAPIVPTVGALHQFTAVELDTVDQQVGADLTLQTSGFIKSTAGGVFSAQVTLTLA